MKIIVLIFLLLALTACGTGLRHTGDVEPRCQPESVDNNITIDTVNDKTSAEITFTEPNNFMRGVSGVVQATQMGTRQYFFFTDNEAANLPFVLQIEAIVRMLEQYMPTRARIEIFYTEDESLYGVNGHQVFINPMNPNTYGMMIYTLSLGRIPIWLSVGMEIAAGTGLEGDYTPGGLGDIYFAPFYWGTPGHTQAIATSYNFVRFLIDKDYLADIIDLYRNGNTSDADYMAAQIFYQFSGNKLNTFLNLSFSDTFYAYTITANTEMAHYTIPFPSFYYQFQFDDVWLRDRDRYILTAFGADNINSSTLLDYIAYVDNAIKFVKNWYIQFLDFDFIPIRTEIAMRSLAYAGAAAYANHGRMRLSVLSLTAAAHEASHVISRFVGGTIFPPFDEGLADVLHVLHANYDKNNHGFEYRIWEELWANVTVQLLYQQWGNFSKDALRNYLLNNFNSTAFRHVDSYISLNYTNIDNNPSFNFSPRHPHYIPELNTHDTASSFVHYLIETRGAEAYVQVHFDINLFEYVYGKTLHEMVDEWLAFLSCHAEQFFWEVTQ